jgi:hypothetical protein
MDEQENTVPIQLGVLAEVVQFLSDAYSEVQQMEINAITERAAIRAARHRAEAARISALLVRVSTTLAAGEATWPAEPDAAADAEGEVEEEETAPV